MLPADAMLKRGAGSDRLEHIHALVVEILGDLLRAPLADLDATIDRALARLGQFCGVDRTYVFLMRTDGGAERIDNTHEWVADGIEATIDLSQDLPAEMMGPWRERFDADAWVEVQDVAALPDDMPLKEHLAAQAIRSLLAVPIRADGRLAGFVGFDAVRLLRVFPTGEVLLLKSVADAIGNVLLRRSDAAQIARAQALLVRAHDRLKATLDALPDLVLEVDADGRFTDVHTADPDQLFLPADEFLGRTMEQVLPPDLAALGRRAMAEVAERGRSGVHHYELDFPQGRRAFALSAALRPPEADDTRPGHVFVIRDVTDERRLLRETERLGLIARNMTNLVIITDAELRIEWVNPAFEARTGWGLDEVRGRRPPALSRGAGTDAATAAAIDAALSECRPVRAEILNFTRWGAPYWVDVQIHPLHEPDGRHSGFVSIETDITERKQQEEALARLAREATEARDRLEMAVEALPDAFTFYDADDGLVLCNERYRSLYPLTAPLMVPGTRFAVIARHAVEHGEVPAAIGCEEEWLARRMRAHSNPGSSEERQLSDGRWLKVMEKATPGGGRVGLRIDITELKQAEQRLSDIIEGAEAGTWEWRPARRQYIFNARWAGMLGYTPEALRPMTLKRWLGLVHPDDIGHADARLAEVLAGRCDQVEYELRMRHLEGHWVWVLSRGRVVRRDADGAPEVIAGVHLDITALKRAEQRLEEIIDAAEAGTWEHDLRTGINRINDRWAGMLGYARADLEARPETGFRELVHPDDLAMLDRQHRERVLKGTERFANEFRLRHREGHWVWVLSRGRIVARDPSGRPAKVAGIHLDVTERKRLESALTGERDFLARLMETSISCITALDAEGRIIFANRAAESVLGLEPARIAGRAYNDPAWQITTIDGQPIRSEDLPFRTVIATGRPVRDMRHAIVWPDGTRHILSVNAAPLQAEGLAARVVCSVTDVTAQVAAEEALRAAAERAEAANRAKSRFLANMSHEIRTPLNGVLGMAQVLEASLGEPSQRRMLSVIRESGEMLLGVLNDVLDMSKIEAGKLTLERVPFVPAELGARIAALHGVQATEKGLCLRIDARPGAEVSRLGDPNRIQQVLHNLVSNALKFTETGGVTVQIGEGADGALEIGVSDTGMGMTREQVLRVFEDFEQGDGTVTRRFGGTGLGMSIVRRLVSLMEGEIAVDSTEGVGTQVRIRLPLEHAGCTPAAPGAGAAPCRDRPAASVDPAAGLAGLRALAVDDNATNRLILGAMLGSLGLDVAMAVDGPAALSVWGPGAFEVLLLDISMPGMDGISLLSAIRAREAAAGVAPVPAIAITANAMAHQVAEYIAAGFAGHVGKPFRREDLAEAIRGVRPG